MICTQMVANTSSHNFLVPWEFFILYTRKTNLAFGRHSYCKKKIYQCALVLPDINSKRSWMGK